MMQCKGRDIGPATGFVYRVAYVDYLVSNWHVFSGRNTYTGQPLHPQGAIPDTIKLSFHTAPVGSWIEDVQIPLYSISEEPRWIQHELGQRHDIAAIKLRRLPLAAELYPANPKMQNPEIIIEVTQDAFIVGFPRGLAMQGIFPVWKRGTIASEPNLPISDGSPTILIDAATREGMSGSPVFVRINGQARFADGSAAMLPGVLTQLVGVYSGRFGAKDEVAAQLGRVWKIETLIEMLRNPAQGTYELVASEQT